MISLALTLSPATDNYSAVPYADSLDPDEMQNNSVSHQIQTVLHSDNIFTNFE